MLATRHESAAMRGTAHGAFGYARTAVAGTRSLSSFGWQPVLPTCIEATSGVAVNGKPENLDANVPGGGGGLSGHV